jgi:hypothetical protein
MTKSIPYVGETYLGDFPAPMKVARVTFGFSSDDDVPMAAQGVYDLITLPANAVVLSAKTIVKTAFTSSVTITIGDSDDADGWSASATIAPQTAVSTGILTSGGGAYAAGKIYSASQPLQATVGGANVAAGEGELFIQYAIAAND